MKGIDNTTIWLPVATTFLIAFLIVVMWWFFNGGSFRLYASIFFGLYYLTRQIWLAVLLVGIAQNIVFIPLHLLGDHFSNRIEDFENELKKTTEDQQYLLFKEQVRKGNLSIIFYILNFVINGIAFLSAGRIFLIDFYNQKLNPAYLYHFIPYPEYPLQGTIFKLPFIQITQSTAIEWKTIGIIILVVLGLVIIPSLLWRLVKPWLSKNPQLLQIRINRNKVLTAVGGASIVLTVGGLYLLRHIPTEFKLIVLMADLTRQNTTMNTITALGTFFTTMHFGFSQNRKAEKEAREAEIPKDIIAKVSEKNIKNSFRNAVVLGIGAFFLTNQIPCAFELSVAMFEVLVILSPYTFDRLFKQKKAKIKAEEITAVETTIMKV